MAAQRACVFQRARGNKSFEQSGKALTEKTRRTPNANSSQRVKVQTGSKNIPPSVTWPERPLMPTCGDGVSRTRPGEHRRRTNLRNCQDPLVLVSCGVCRRCVCSVSSFLFFFFANRPFAADHQSESARCVSNTRRGTVEAVADPPRECAKNETTPTNSRGLPSNSDCTSHISWTMCIFGLIFHRLSS